MNRILVLISASLLLASTHANAGKYKLDTGHSNMGFKIRHLGISNVSGNFAKFSGSGTFNEKTGKIGSLNVEMQADSINTNEADRDKHLRSGDFFEVKKYPKLTFKSTKVVHKGKKPTEIHGKLTIRGVTKDIKLKVTDWGGVATDPWGNQRVAFEARGEIDRTDFGLKWNKGLKKAGGLLVGNKVKLIIEAQGIKQ